MSTNIFSGVGVRVFYTSDIANRSVSSPSMTELTDLAGFPEFSTASESKSIESYDNEYSGVLLGQRTINNIDIVVNWKPDAVDHSYLESRLQDGKQFQLLIYYNEDKVNEKVEAVVLNGVISSSSIEGSKDEVVTKTYSFVPMELLSQGTRAIPPELRRGDYGIGSDGSADYPQYAPVSGAEGNALIKLNANNTDNPAGVDMHGVEWVDGGKHSSITMTMDGDLRIYAKNNTTPWTRILSSSETNNLYLAKDANLSDLGSVSIARTNLNVYSKSESDSKYLIKASNLSDLTNKATARSNLELDTWGIVEQGTTLTTFDWQTFVFKQNATYIVNASTWTNVPAGLPTASLVSIQCNAVANAEGVNRRYQFVVSGLNNGSNRQQYDVSGYGAVGSRTFQVQQSLTTGAVISVAQGGTGATTNDGTGAVNIGALPMRLYPPSTITDINQMGSGTTNTTYVGVWSFTGSAQYNLINVPVPAPGTLEVLQAGAYNSLQRYTTRYGQVFTRSLTAVWTEANPNVWSQWVSAADSIYPLFVDADANTLITPGSYAVASTAPNLPLVVTGRITVIQRQPAPQVNFGAVQQTYTTFSSVVANSNRVFTRYYDGTNWTDWKENVTTSNINSIIQKWGIGSASINQVTDLDTITETGFYRYGTTANSNPLPSASGTLEHVSYSTAYASQTVHTFQLQNPTVWNRTFTRTLNNGVWGTWRELYSTGNVVAVENGGTGGTTPDTARTGISAAKSGINSDITSLTGLTTPIVVGTPINGNQAATKQYVDNLVGTGSGNAPTMTGVINWGVGQSYWKHTRANLNAVELPQDGQILLRATYPDLWAYAQSTSPITDAAWLADKTKRGRFSTGNGTTTFRLPDLNGVQSGSIAAPFLRGDGGSSGLNGNINESGAPNIRGSLSILADGSQNSHLNTDYGVGALYTAVNNAGGNNKDGFTPNIGAGYYGGIGLDASKSSSIYKDGLNEIVPNAAYGVMVIRAYANFVAANTEFNVVVGTDVLPNVGTEEAGGKLTSDYYVGGNKYGSISLQAGVTIGERVVPQIVIHDKTSGTDVVSTINLGEAGGMGKNICEMYWHHSTTYTPDGTVAGNGQIFNKATYPDVYQMIVDGKVPVTTDAEWLSTPSKRNCYALVGTDQFRVPDYNGVTSGSILAPFLRGKGTATAPFIQESAVPNLTARINGYSILGRIDDASNNSTKNFFNVVRSVTNNYGGTVAAAEYGSGIEIDASRVSKVYQTGATEVRPNAVIGQYVIVMASKAVNPGDVNVTGLASDVDQLRTNLNTTNERVGYALLDFGTMSKSARKAMTNPFGNNTPVMCLAEVQRTNSAGVLGWTATGWIYNSNASLSYGTQGTWLAGTGIVVQTGSAEMCNSNINTGLPMDTGNVGTGNASCPVRVHVWKVTQ